MAAFTGSCEDREVLNNQIKNGFTIIGKRLIAVTSMIEEGNFENANSLRPLQVDLIEKIDLEIHRLSSQIETMEAAGTDAERMNLLQVAEAELRDTKKLNQEIEVIVERQKTLVERLKVIDARLT